ncbi:hypothetical protein H0H81_007774 [Sphagnurus paluster]|uniref:Uncharacterized protein n=1 Tax=Sphagnurus paluster TaxID=117069 RepID=A0A9P7FSK0_9AGAR|nr:hypothetical protein H0H81_007774 [Sphagnurus paluster]
MAAKRVKPRYSGTSLQNQRGTSYQLMRYLQLQDVQGNVIAYFRPTRPTRYQIGDVYGELHFIRAAGTGTVMHPPIMDTVVVTSMLYRFCAQWNL